MNLSEESKQKNLQEEEDDEEEVDEPTTMADWIDDDENDEEINDSVEIIDLFSSNIYHNLQEYLKYLREKYEFDLIHLIKSINGDEIACIMMINYIRSLLIQSNYSIPISEVIKLILTKEFLTLEQYMTPTLPNDSLLYLLSEYIEEYDPENQLNNDEEWEKSNKYTFLDHVIPIPEPTLPPSQDMTTILSDEQDNGLIGDYYFDGYSHIHIHEVMLRDTSRTLSYSNAFQMNSSLLAGKVVLDVGCGTGILSMLAIKSGAKKVIGIDMSSIIPITKQIIQRNGYGHCISLIRGKMEDVELPLEPNEQVDIIVSEWMGYGLYFENMLPAVIYARDKYLKKDENDQYPAWSIMPSSASLYIEAISAQHSPQEDRVEYWSNVYGFNMMDMVNLFLPEAQVDLISPQLSISSRSLFHELSILKASDRDLDFSRTFQIVSLLPCIFLLLIPFVVWIGDQQGCHVISLCHLI